MWLQTGPKILVPCVCVCGKLGREKDRCLPVIENEEDNVLYLLYLE